MKVSIVVPVYNYGNVLPRAMRSIQAQVYRDYEVIIVNDGSTDDSGAVADMFKSDRVRVVHQPNQGLSAALNTGFKQATGDAFLILSADDELSPAHLAATVDEMRRKNADIVSSDMLVNNRRVPCKPGSLELLRSSNCHHYAALFKREWFDKTGGFKTTMNPSWEDYEIWLHCAELGAKWAHVSQPLFVYHPTSTGRDASSQGKDLLLRGKLEGYHQNLFGVGAGVVAFVIPLYNHEKFVRYAIESVKTQTYPHVAAIVVDDASPEFAKDAVAGLDCVVLHHDRNRGLAAARNTGIAYADTELHAQYYACLDADDGVAPEFVEETLPLLEPGARYVYTDVKFIGAAWHEHKLKPFDCERLARKHQHACTFLAETEMWRNITMRRGYGYDECDLLRTGYEDMEFTLACIENHYQGKHLAKPLFQYRQHANGSMRENAKAVDKKTHVLTKYIHDQHSWIKTREGIHMACSTCGGGGKYTMKGNKVVVPNVGELGINEPLMVTYTGNASGALTKMGVTRRIYRPSKNNRVFFIDPRDAHLFQGGPYRVEKAPTQAEQVTAANTAAQKAASVVKETVTQRVAFAEKIQETAQRFETERVNADRVDDLSELPSFAPDAVARAAVLGVKTFAQIAELTAPELRKLVGKRISAADVEEIKAHAKLLSSARH